MDFPTNVVFKTQQNYGGNEGIQFFFAFMSFEFCDSFVQLSLIIISLHAPSHYSFGHIHMLFTIIARFLLMSFFVII
jgi:hypothetical protein